MRPSKRRPHRAPPPRTVHQRLGLYAPTRPSKGPRDKSGLSAYYGKLSTAAVTKAGATLSACDALTVGGSSVTVQ